MKKAFEWFNLSEEEKANIIEFITDSIDLWYEWFEKLKKERLIPWWWIKISKFMSFARKECPELLQKFNETLIQPDIIKRQEYEEWKIKWLMKAWKEKFIDEHYIEKWEYDLVVYKKIHCKIYEHKDGTIEKILQISIPYMLNMSPKPKFAWSILVSSLKTPKLFADFMADIPQFTWDTDLVSKRQ